MCEGSLGSSQTLFKSKKIVLPKNDSSLVSKRPDHWHDRTYPDRDGTAIWMIATRYQFYQLLYAYNNLII